MRTTLMHCLRRAGRLARRAFTIIEILIAIVVLVLGIVGIIALFPTAIDSGNKTIEDSYAAAITQSVVDAITVGLRESRYTYRPSSNVSWTYFVFNHDGVIDPPPSKPEDFTASQSPYAYTAPPGVTADKMWDKDYCIVLPQAVTGLSPSSANASGIWPAGTPNTDFNNEPYFIYPVPLTPPAEADQHSFTRLQSGSVVDNLHVTRQRPDRQGVRVDWIPRTYKLGIYRDPGNPPGQNLPPGSFPGQIRQEFQGEQINVGGSPTQTIAFDPYPTYSYAFAIQRARIDTNNNGRIDVVAGPGAPTPDAYSSNLYQVRVFVFKNFNQAEADALATPTPDAFVPKNNVPIHRFVTLISL